MIPRGLGKLYLPHLDPRMTTDRVLSLLVARIISAAQVNTHKVGLTQIALVVSNGIDILSGNIVWGVTPAKDRRQRGEGFLS